MTSQTQGQQPRNTAESCTAAPGTAPTMQTETIGKRAVSAQAANGVAPTIQDGLEDWSTSDEEFRRACKELDDKVTRFLGEQHDDAALQGLQEQIRGSLQPLAEALKTYSFDQLSFSYNGGKDCLVLLILYLIAIHRHYSLIGAPMPTSLKSIYIQPPHPFPQVTEFVDSSSAYYHVCLSSSALPMKEAFAQYLERHPEVKVIFVGTRRTDPHGGKLTHFDITDGGWPQFMRCHPVIDWHYREIWAVSWLCRASRGEKADVHTVHPVF
ncbi:hypothetical protein FH972_026093 [Carpinus fangiana]|uniref:FAD synthase n=1 Tax=Carpinus fangiana TaxID=176857 RepID=A0A5N6L3B1_9ROSI|nr:hypothetical protein FH972_026093 [Carpinus fangiana]